MTLRPGPRLPESLLRDTSNMRMFGGSNAGSDPVSLLLQRQGAGGEEGGGSSPGSTARPALVGSACMMGATGRHRPSLQRIPTSWQMRRAHAAWHPSWQAGTHPLSVSVARAVLDQSGGMVPKHSNKGRPGGALRSSNNRLEKLTACACAIRPPMRQHLWGTCPPLPRPARYEGAHASQAPASKVRRRNRPAALISDRRLASHVLASTHVNAQPSVAPSFPLAPSPRTAELVVGQQEGLQVKAESCRCQAGQLAAELVAKGGEEHEAKRVRPAGGEGPCMGQLVGPVGLAVPHLKVQWYGAHPNSSVICC